MKRKFCAPIGALVLLMVVGRGQAARVEADPSREYAITPEAGPWMIFGASYTGPNAPQMANELVLMLRRRDNLPAYVFNRGKEQREQQKQYLQELHQRSPEARPRLVHIEEQYAVLIGGYKDIDTARKALDSIKKLKPPDSEKLMDQMRVIAPAEASGSAKQKAEVRGAFVNPFVNSFVVRNPTVSAAATTENENSDAFLKELNSGESYSLLHCKPPWTLAVKEFRGAGIVQPKAGTSSFLEKLLSGKSGESLNAAGMQAHELARVLREFKFEAYVLHTRQSSVVTVGTYAAPDDPQLQRMQRQLAALNLRSGKPTPKVGPEAEYDPLQLFAQPMPMKVPRP